MAGIPFSLDTVAGMHHDAGVDLAAKQGLFDDAHSQFIAALMDLDLMGNAPDVEVQRARVERDLGFTYVRELAAGRESASVRADQLLHGSFKTTERLLADENEDFTRKQTSYLHAEHGATIMCQARLLTVKCVLGGSIGEVRDARNLYGDAHEELTSFLGWARNPDYAISNAVSALRHARLFGIIEPQALWFLRAASLASNAAIFPRHGSLTGITKLEKLPHLATRESAKKSVLSRP